MAPPMAPQSASPIVKSIDTKVDRMSLKDVIAMNKKMAKDKPKPKLDFMSELKQQVLKPKLKKASDRKIKEKEQKQESVHESLMRELSKNRKFIGEGLYRDSFYDPKEYRHAHLSNNFNILMNERNRYGFGY